MRKTITGFTIIELLIVISVIGILTTIAFVSYNSIQLNARDANRSAQITIIAEALENYYENNGEYPSCSAMAQEDPDTVTTTVLIGLDPKVLTDPSDTDGQNSILSGCAGLSAQTPNKFSYTGDGTTNCLTVACQEYTLKYNESATNSIKELAGRNSPTASLADSPGKPEISLMLNGADVLTTITPLSCTLPSVIQYSIQNSINGLGDYSTWLPNTTSTVLAIEGYKYDSRAKTRCYVSDFSYSDSDTSDTLTYVHPISSIPSAPTVSVTSSTWPTTVFEWTTTPSQTCPTSTSIRYQYQYKTSAGYVSEWTPATNNTISRTTSAAPVTYTLDVRAQCYSDYYTDAPWVSGTASYYRAAPTVIAEIWGGGGGGHNGGGTPAGGDTSTGGGGGGGYSKSTLTLSTGTGYWAQVGNAGGIDGNGGDSYFINTSTLLAKGGLAGTGSVAGAGGQAGSGVGQVRHSGGSGGFGDQGGGGGAAGPHGNGNSGWVDNGGVGDAGYGGCGGYQSGGGCWHENGGGGGGGSGNNGVGGPGGGYGGGGGAGEDNGNVGIKGRVKIYYVTGTMSATGGSSVFNSGGYTYHYFDSGSATFTTL